MKNISLIVLKRIDDYDAAGNLGHTTKLMLALSGINHTLVAGHLERVALLAELVAKKQGKDAKAAFFAGLLHDLGKLILPADLFNGREINSAEYAIVKEHARDGFEVLRQFHGFVSLCAGAHHAMYKQGYGLSITDFPTDWSLQTIKKVLDISTIISICDFIDAYSTRTTVIKDGSDQKSANLFNMLAEKYPNDLQTIKIAMDQMASIYF